MIVRSTKWRISDSRFPLALCVAFTVVFGRSMIGTRARIWKQPLIDWLKPHPRISLLLSRITYSNHCRDGKTPQTPKPNETSHPILHPSPKRNPLVRHGHYSQCHHSNSLYPLSSTRPMSSWPLKLHQSSSCDTPLKPGSHTR